MYRYLVFAALLAVAAAFGAFVLGNVFPLMTLPVVAIVLFFCPSYALMAATAACEALDPCALNMLVLVVTLNIGLYCLLALTLWLTRNRWKSVRIGVFAVTAVATTCWASQWV